MPELPEVETMRRGIASIVGRRIALATFPKKTRQTITISPRPRTLAGKLVGRCIVAVHRFGKRIAIEFDGTPNCGKQFQPHWLVIEPRMTGLLLLAEPPTPQHVRLDIRLSQPRQQAGPHVAAPAATGRPSKRDSQLVFWDRRGLGTVRFVDKRGLLAACGPDRLGPDALSITGRDFVARLGRSSRAVKVALLDQKAVAGIGNIYAAEILFHAGVDPRTPCRLLTVDRWKRIARVTRHLLAKAIQCEGSTIGDGTSRTADNRSGQFQLYHRVYGQKGMPCHACNGPIERIVQAQRSTFFCPRCQW